MLCPKSNVRNGNNKKYYKKWNRYRCLSFVFYRRSTCYLLLIILVSVCVIDTWIIGNYRIVHNPITLIFDSQSMQKIHELQQTFDNGRNFLRNQAPGILCTDESYIQDLNDHSKSTFLTLLVDAYNLNYLRSALVWCYQISQLHQSPKIDVTIVIDSATLAGYAIDGQPHHGDGITKWFQALGATNIIVLNEDHTLFNKNAKKRYWQTIYTKLILFDPMATNFTQIAYFDADNFPLQSMYELFDIPCPYLLGAANDNYDYDALNAGFLHIRPHKTVYDALMAAWQLERDFYRKGTTEQQMIRDLWDGYNAVHNTFWYKFPYEYNTPFWGLNGGLYRQKNIHNKLWKMFTGKNKARLAWDKAWATVWQILSYNNLTHNMLDLDKCTKRQYYKEGDIDVCSKERIA